MRYHAYLEWFSSHDGILLLEQLEQLRNAVFSLRCCYFHVQAGITFFKFGDVVCTSVMLGDRTRKLLFFGNKIIFLCKRFFIVLDPQHG